MRVLIVGLFILISFVPLVGCIEDSREIDHRSMIVGLSIDKGKEDKYAVTLQIPVLQPGSDQGSSPFEKEFESFTDEGETLWDAIGNLEAKTPAVLFFGHLKVVTISEEVAKEGLNEVVDFIDRIPQVANQIYMLVIEKSTAEDFLKTESALVSLPSLYLNRFFQADQKVGRTTDVKLFEYIRDSNMISRATTLPLAYIEEGNITIENMVVFENHQMVGKIIHHEVAMSNLLKKRAVDQMNYTIDIEHEDETFKVAISRIKLKANIDFEKKDPVKFHFDIKGEGEVVELTTTEVALSRELISKINDKMNKQLEKEIRNVIAKMKEINVEPWLLGHRVWAMDYKFFDTLNWEETGWQQAEFNINIDFKVEMTGQRGMLEKKKIGR